VTDGRRRGGVRIRSNVVLEKNGRAAETLWAHVPGEIVEIHKPGYLRGALSSQKRQLDERGYYLECTYCHRLAHQIGREGCEDRRCVLSRPSSEAVERNRARHHEALELISLEHEHLTAEGLSGTEQDDELPPVLSPEAAVERLLGSESVASVGVQEEAPPEVIQPEAETAGAYEAARSSLVEAAEATGRFTAGYCTAPTDNLVDTLTLGQVRQALADLAHGDGSELMAAETTPPKFHAAHSSSALVINNFAAWIGREQWLQLGGQAGFNSVRFEAKFPTGLGGRPPNLDVYLSGPSSHLAIESKCTEHLSPHVASFQPSYDDLVDEIAHSSWQKLFGHLKDDPNMFTWLDAGQLVRHYLGLRRAVVDGGIPRIGLLYLYWEPRPPVAEKTIAEHRAEAEVLMAEAADPSVPFLAMSYRMLWETWTAPGRPDWLVAHVATLGARYDVPPASAPEQ
jgi:hypothetical protein